MHISKQILVALFSLGLVFNSFAQVSPEEFDLVQTVYGMEKREIFEEFLGEEVNKDFWSLYKEYEAKRSDLGKRRFQMLKSYAKDYLQMNDAKASGLLKNFESLNADYNKLIALYSRKIEKNFGASVAIQFYQLEHYFLSLTRTEIIENIPTIADMLSEG